LLHQEVEVRVEMLERLCLFRCLFVVVMFVVVVFVVVVVVVVVVVRWVGYIETASGKRLVSGAVLERTTHIYTQDR
jgi:hypothetical protein